MITKYEDALEFFVSAWHVNELHFGSICIVSNFYLSQVSIERKGYTRIIMQTMSNRVFATLEPSQNNVQLDFNYLSDSVIA